MLKIHDFSKARILEIGKNEKIFGQDPSLFNHFSSPEILMKSEYNHTTDVWSIGVVCYILISGTFPFCASSLPRLLEKVTSKNFKFDSYRWNLISESSKDFLSKTFEPNKNLRITAEEALLHRGMYDGFKQQGSYKKQALHRVEKKALQFNYFFRRSTKIVCNEITQNESIHEDSMILFKILNKATLKTLIDTFQKIKGSYPTNENFQSIEDLLQQDTSRLDKLRKLVFLQKGHKDQKIGIIVVSTRQFYCIVAKILPEGLAEKEGTLQVGDRIISINGIVLCAESEDEEGKTLSHSIKAATVVKQANKLFSSQESELRIIIEPGYEYLIKDQPFLQKRLEIAENTEFEQNARYLRVIKSCNVAEDLKNQKCMKISKGDIIALNDFNCIDSKWWFSYKVIPDFVPELSEPNYVACLLESDSQCKSGLVPAQIDMSMYTTFYSNLSKNNAKFPSKPKSCSSGILSRTASRLSRTFSKKSRVKILNGLYEEVILVQGFKYKTVVILGSETINFSIIIKNICSRLVLSHCTVPITTTNKKYSKSNRYNVIKESQFLNLVKAKAFIDWTMKNGNYYGYLKKSILDIMEHKRVPIIAVSPKAVSILRTSLYCPLIIYLEGQMAQKIQENNAYSEMDENEFTLNQQSPRSNTLIYDNTFTSIRHLTDYCVKFDTNQYASAEVLRLVQTQKTTFVTREWCRNFKA
ncbi:hypothetical protein MXB_2080 [Myxobolus squamalis]|nr:hypothetical protein MXB_2080 [Myxobolus squamalis]